MRILILVSCVVLCFVACDSSSHTQDKRGSVSASQLDSPQQVGVQTSLDSSRPLPDPEILYRKCASCHGKDGKSVAPGSVNGVLIASLNKEQVRELLKGFRARTLSRGGNSIIMYMQTQKLSDEDIESLANYIDAF